MSYEEQKIVCSSLSVFLTNGEFKGKKNAREFAVPSSTVCPSILIQGPQRGCSEHRLFGVSIATATKLPLQRPPEGCVSTFHPLSRPIKLSHLQSSWKKAI